MAGHSRSKNGVASLASCPGHPRLALFDQEKTWMPGTSPGNDGDMDASVTPELQAALDRLAQGKSRRELTQRAGTISQLFRSGAGSRDAIRTDDDALAYAFTRLPATFAAMAAA